MRLRNKFILFTRYFIQSFILIYSYQYNNVKLLYLFIVIQFIMSEIAYWFYSKKISGTNEYLSNAIDIIIGNFKEHDKAIVYLDKKLKDFIMSQKKTVDKTGKSRLN